MEAYKAVGASTYVGEMLVHRGCLALKLIFKS